MTPTHSKENPPAQQAWAARQPCKAGGEAVRSRSKSGGGVGGQYVPDMENSLTVVPGLMTRPRSGSKHPLVSGALPCRLTLNSSDMTTGGALPARGATMEPVRWGVCPEQGQCPSALQLPWEPRVRLLTRVSCCVGTS